MVTGSSSLGASHGRRTNAARKAHQRRTKGVPASHGRRTSAARTPETRLNHASMALKVLLETRLKCTSKRRAIVFFYTIANRIVRDAEAMHVSLILFSIHFILNEKIFQNYNEKEK